MFYIKRKPHCIWTGRINKAEGKVEILRLFCLTWSCIDRKAQLGLLPLENAFPLWSAVVMTKYLWYADFLSFYALVSFDSGKHIKSHLN